MFTEKNRHVSLLHAINKILLKDWDPLCIYRNPALQDEYEEYLLMRAEIIKQKFRDN